MQSGESQHDYSIHLQYNIKIEEMKVWGGTIKFSKFCRILTSTLMALNAAFFVDSKFVMFILFLALVLISFFLEKN